MVTTIDTDRKERREELIEKLVGDTIASLELMGTYLGLRLGLYRVLEEGPATAAKLASRAGIDQRYAREWLEQQAVAGIVDVDDVKLGPEDRSFILPVPHREVLVDEGSPHYVAPLAFAAGIARVLPNLVDAYRTGDGVPFGDYGEDIVDHIEALNRPMFVNDLASKWVPGIPDLHQRLSEQPAKVLDIACGAGWSSIALAQGYPNVRVDGFDLDQASIARAKQNAAAAGVADRVNFEVRDAADPGLGGSYEAVFIFEALHDMARPVEALVAARRALAAGGSVIVGDEKVAESFAAPGDEVERLMYGFSITHCLPVGRTESRSAATGTMMRPDTLRTYAREAGFAAVEVLPIENDLWRFYRLKP